MPKINAYVIDPWYKAMGQGRNMTLHKQFLALSLTFLLQLFCTCVISAENDEIDAVINAAAELTNKGSYSEAESLLVAKLNDNSLKTESIKAANISHILGVVSIRQGKYAAAQIYLEHAIEIFEKKSHQNLIKLAEARIHLGKLFQIQLKLTEALETHKNTWKLIFKKVEGDVPQYQKIIIELCEALAGTCSDSGKYWLADHFYKKSLENARLLYGEASETTAQIMANFSLFYANIHKWDEALELSLSAQKFYEDMYGKNHPEIAVIITNQGLIQRKLGHLKKAESIYLKGITIANERLTEQHPVALALKLGLAAVYIDMEKHEEAGSLLHGSLEKIKLAMGNNHLAVSRTYFYLGNLYRAQGKHNEAIAWYQKAIQVESKIIPPRLNGTAELCSNLAISLRAVGRKEDAVISEEIAEKAKKAWDAAMHEPDEKDKLEFIP